MPKIWDTTDVMFVLPCGSRHGGTDCALLKEHAEMPTEMRSHRVHFRTNVACAIVLLLLLATSQQRCLLHGLLLCRPLLIAAQSNCRCHSPSLTSCVLWHWELMYCYWLGAWCGSGCGGCTGTYGTNWTTGADCRVPPTQLYLI